MVGDAKMSTSMCSRVKVGRKKVLSPKPTFGLFIIFIHRTIIRLVDSCSEYL